MSVLKILIAISAIIAINFPVNARAETSAPTPEVLRELAYGHEFQELESILDQLQEDVLAGRVGFDDQRQTYVTLSSLHPDLIDAVLAWRGEMPNSNHARAARIWMLFWAGWHMRGEDTSRWIYPDAKSEFHRLHREALKLAKAGFSQQPDFVPVSDAVLRLKLTVRSAPSIWDLLQAEPFERVMELTPNRGSLMRRLAVTQPSWGGSFDEVEEICENYAPMVRDVEGYTAEICMADAIYYYNYNSAELLRWAQQVLADTDSPVLDYARWLDAVRDRPFLEGAQVRITKNLDTLGYRSLIEAIRYDAKYAHPRYLPKLAPQLYLLLHKRAMAEQEHDPYNPDLLGVLMKTQILGTRLELGPDWATWEEYHRRKIAYSPNSAELWGDYASKIAFRRKEGEEVSEAALSHLDDYYINAIIYSNYKPEHLWFFRENKFKLLQEVMPTLNLHGIKPSFSASEMDEQNEMMVCPFIRIDRIQSAVCGADQQQSFCGAGPGLELYHNRIYEIAHERNACETELNTPIEELVFTPVEFEWARYPFH